MTIEIDLVYIYNIGLLQDLNPRLVHGQFRLVVHNNALNAWRREPSLFNLHGEIMRGVSVNLA